MKEKDDILDDGQIYEVGFHILPTVPEEKLQSVVLELENSITQNGGSIIFEEFPKTKILSYEMKKTIGSKCLNFKQTFFGWIKFEILPTSISKVREGITNNENILRFVLIKTVKENTTYAFKPPTLNKENSTEKMAKIPRNLSIQADKVEVSEEEIDKSIDELLVNGN